MQGMLRLGEDNKNYIAKGGKYLCQKTKLRVWAMIVEKLALLSCYGSFARRGNMMRFTALIIWQKAYQDIR